ncbi:MAG: hypothetical protein ACI9BW_002260 [Gammaproteobacteria bacterium]|jgi:hypothetical protein
MKTYNRDYTNDYDLDDPEISDNWDDIVTDLHARCPVARSEAGEGCWVLSSHEDLSRCAMDWRTFTSRDGFIVNRPQGVPYFPPAEIDPPLQRGLRRVLEPFLRQQTVADLEPTVRQHANTLIDRFIANGRVEAVSAFANPLPQIVFSSAVAGMDPDHMPKLLNDFSFVAPPAEHAQGFQRGMQRIEAYLSERREQPARGDIVDALLAFEHPDFNWMDKVGTLCQLTIGGIGLNSHHERRSPNCDSRRRWFPRRLVLAKSRRTITRARLESLYPESHRTGGPCTLAYPGGESRNSRVRYHRINYCRRIAERHIVRP